MLRHLVRCIHKNLIFSPASAVSSTCLGNHQHLRCLMNIRKPKIVSEEDSQSNLPEEQVTDEYIVPYRSERESPMHVNVFLEVLRSRYRLTASDVKKIVSEETVHKAYRERSLMNALDTLCIAGVNKRSFMDYPWLITLEKNRLDLKIAMIRTMDVRDINHFVPFMRLTLPRLRKLVSFLNREAQMLPNKSNRVYYICEKLQTDPYIVTKYLSKRLFILEMPFEMLEQNLNHMIQYNVSPMNLLKDLWAFRYTPKAVQLRLERAKSAKKDKIMPWMVRCPEPILQRSLKLSIDELEVLGENNTVAEYVAERLEFGVDETKAIMDKHPQVHTVRVTKIKEVLDYLLDEAKFTRYEIAQVPRIMCHSLETTKNRIDELKSIGCRPSSLVIICRSKREYEKFVKTWKEMKTTIYKQPL